MDPAAPAALSRSETEPARLCEAFVNALFVTGASISVFGRDGQQSTICATDSIAARSETLQFELGEGPHWEALEARVPVLLPDLSQASPSRWPMFQAAAQEIGISAVFAFPMTMGSVTIGVLDLYCAEPRRLDSHQVSLASSMARRSAPTAVCQAMRSAEEGFASEHEKVPALRREVHQATGMIQAQLGTTATDAFLRLRARAFASGVPVDEVAREIVARRLTFQPAPE
jgi:transcriptional regulator with GAF, ATPase, and Fis domain